METARSSSGPDTSRSDDQFFTPRATAITAREYASSDDERYTTPRALNSARSGISDGEKTFRTPREYISSDDDGQFQSGFVHGRDVFDDADGTYSIEIEPPSRPSFTDLAARIDPFPLTEAGKDVFSLTRHSRYEDVQNLLENGMPVNMRDNFGNTILIIAAQNGLKRMMKLALRRGADINAQNHKGNTALHYCYAYGYEDSLGQYLISKGADTNVINTDGLFPYQGI